MAATFTGSKASLHCEWQLVTSYGWIQYMRISEQMAAQLPHDLAIAFEHSALLFNNWTKVLFKKLGSEQHILQCADSKHWE